MSNEYLIISPKNYEALLYIKKWYDDLFTPKGLLIIRGLL